MTLRAIYRSYGGENLKLRPPYYSKLLALASFVRAVEQVQTPIDVTFLNDGPVGTDELRLMRDAGTVVERERLGCRGSYAEALSLAIDGTGEESDLVWLAEDDYLYRTDALEQLASAARLIPWASYFGLYATVPTPDDPSTAPVGWRDRGGANVNGHEWRHAVSTTSTFGARLSSLRKDRHLLRLAPYSSHAWDLQTCLAYQGYPPFRGRGLLQDPVTGSAGSFRSRMKILGATPVKLVVDAFAYRRARRPGLLVASVPGLATHLQLPFIAPGTDWEAEARSVTAWTRERVTSTRSSGSS